MESKFKQIHAPDTVKFTPEFVKFPFCGSLTWEAFVNKWFFIHERDFTFELGLMAASRLDYLEPT